MMTEHKDRYVGLVIFGVCQILLGLLCALMIPLSLLPLLAASNEVGMTVRMLLPAVVMYGLMAAWFIGMGIGSTLARRWARALTLISAWCWLTCGAGALAYLLWFMPDMFGAAPHPGMSDEALQVMRAVVYGFMTLFYIIIPGVLVLFYRSPNVKATCETRDPCERWTDRCPLPVLALSLIAGMWGASFLFLGFYHWTVPFFGHVLKGGVGAAAIFVGAVAALLVAVGAYRLDMRAWWGATALLALVSLSSITTFFRIDMMDYYRDMGFPEEQLQIMAQYPTLDPQSMTIFIAIWFCVAAAFLLLVHRFFTSPSHNNTG